MGAISEQDPKPEGELYFEAQMKSLEQVVQEYRDNPDSNPFEWVLEISILQEAETYSDYNEEGSEMVEIETGGQIVKGHEFLISWGGPESRLTTYNHGKSWVYSYCNWFGSDAWSTGLTGSQVDLMEQAFGVYFECLEDSQKVGAWSEQ